MVGPPEGAFVLRENGKRTFAKLKKLQLVKTDSVTIYRIRLRCNCSIVLQLHPVVGCTWIDGVYWHLTAGCNYNIILQLHHMFLQFLCMFLKLISRWVLQPFLLDSFIDIYRYIYGNYINRSAYFASLLWKLTYDEWVWLLRD